MFGSLAFLGWKGSKPNHLLDIWRFLIVALTMLTINYLVWNSLFTYTADLGCRVIELTVLSLSPLGLVFLQEKKVVNFKDYLTADPENKSIYLSGYGSEEE